MLKKEYFEKKRFRPFRRHLYQNGKVENMLVVARRLVVISFRRNFHRILNSVRVFLFQKLPKSRSVFLVFVSYIDTTGITVFSLLTGSAFESFYKLLFCGLKLYIVRYFLSQNSFPIYFSFCSANCFLFSLLTFK